MISNIPIIDARSRNETFAMRTSLRSYTEMSEVEDFFLNVSTIIIFSFIYHFVHVE